mmetsp:Transcript_13457/g.35290  ORF Transcript_13457/g.35290 Transcript_13457/m.35290 type:complete len:414 (-) Transcript_13457:703-1944(-)
MQLRMRGKMRRARRTGEKDGRMVFSLLCVYAYVHCEAGLQIECRVESMNLEEGGRVCLTLLLQIVYNLSKAEDSSKKLLQMGMLDTLAAFVRRETLLESKKLDVVEGGRAKRGSDRPGKIKPVPPKGLLPPLPNRSEALRLAATVIRSLIAEFTKRGEKGGGDAAAALAPLVVLADRMKDGHLLRLASLSLAQLLSSADALRIDASGKMDKHSTVIYLSPDHVRTFCDFCRSQEPALIRSSLRIIEALIASIEKLVDEEGVMTSEGKDEAATFVKLNAFEALTSAIRIDDTQHQALACRLACRLMEIESVREAGVSKGVLPVVANVFINFAKNYIFGHGENDSVFTFLRVMRHVEAGSSLQYSLLTSDMFEAFASCISHPSCGEDGIEMWDQSIEARAYSATFTLNTFIHTLT